MRFLEKIFPRLFRQDNPLRRYPRKPITNLHNPERVAMIGVSYPATITFKQSQELASYMLAIMLHYGGVFHEQARERALSSRGKDAIWLDNTMIAELTALADTEEELLFIIRVNACIKHLMRSMLHDVTEAAKQGQNLLDQILHTPFNYLAFNSRGYLTDKITAYYSQQGKKAAASASKDHSNSTGGNVIELLKKLMNKSDSHGMHVTDLTSLFNGDKKVGHQSYDSFIQEFYREPPKPPEPPVPPASETLPDKE